MSEGDGPNWQTVVIAFIAGLPALIGTIITAIVSFRHGPKLDEVSKKQDVAVEQGKEVIKATNGLATKFAAASEKAGEAHGRAIGQDEGEAKEHLRQLEKTAAATRREGDRPSDVK